MLGAVPGHNIAALTAASHFSLRSQFFPLCEGIGLSGVCIHSQRVSGSISVQSSNLSAGYLRVRCLSPALKYCIIAVMGCSADVPLVFLKMF